MTMQTMEGGVPPIITNNQGDLTRVYRILDYCWKNPDGGVPVDIAMQQACSLLEETECGGELNHVDIMYRQKLLGLVGNILDRRHTDSYVR